MGRVAAVIACYVGAALIRQTTAQSTPIPVVGVKTGIDPRTGHRPARQNINNLYALGGPHWDLYVLALSAFQEVNETDPLSYSSIAGIHGEPYSAWNGVGHVPGDPKNTGYCPHGELLFPTWHRAYLALFEQTLVSHAVRIADRYHPSQSPTYKGAAQTLRIPFWDWGSQARLPTAATSENITVNGPEGTLTIPNPLYKYRFQRPSVLSQFGPDRPDTEGCGRAGSNNVTESDESMDRIARTLSSQVLAIGSVDEKQYDVFIRTTRFENMAYSHTGGPSFESPHNSVHNNAGCGKTFAAIAWASFDPLFMLHHANVDRYFAMWQAINYNSQMFNSVDTSRGMLGTASGSNVTVSTPLKPFYGQSLTLHTSGSVTQTRDFGYTYPEIDDWSQGPEELANYVRAQVNLLYDRSTDVSPSRRRGLRERQGYAEPPLAQRRYYSAEIQVDRCDVPLPCTLNLMLNGSVVGRMALLAMPRVGVASADIVLTDLKKGDQNIDGMGPDEAVKYLTENIEIEMRLPNNTVAQIGNAPSLKLEIQDMTYNAAVSNSSFPCLGTVRRWPVPVRRFRGYGRSSR
ncbi:Di-copper centre-containing protein [Podospora aff. communis PSN243]|uniref:Di-copper centre-containing protein n=1 Tax=Podospora aff. communis PSN243 TaxID=3040156 RepID=A0AAV9GYC2_9PEZI|nr:Di-copper centre-containing protein [Podospora aff. communis PSN243]